MGGGGSPTNPDNPTTVEPVEEPNGIGKGPDRRVGGEDHPGRHIGKGRPVTVTPETPMGYVAPETLAGYVDPATPPPFDPSEDLFEFFTEDEVNRLKAEVHRINKRQVLR